MARFTFTRDFYITKDATEIKDEHSDAVAYVFDRPRGERVSHEVQVFFGKQNKPVVNSWYGKAEDRDACYLRAFESRRRHVAYKAEEKAKRKAYAHDVKVGDIFRASWGYDQTNVDFYQVIEVRGKHGIFRRIGANSVDTGWLCGQCTPNPGAFLERCEPFRALIQEGPSIKADGHYASRITPVGEKDGKPVYNSTYWSSYA